MAIFLSSTYLGPIQYYSKFFLNDTVFIEREENYLKQSYRNRCNIMSANGVIPLSIPVESGNGLKMQFKDVRISRHGNWQHLHWNAIISAYNSTPFFEYYRDYFEPFYRKSYNYLFDFNEELRCLIFDLLDISTPISFTVDFTKEKTIIDLDLRYSISPKIDWNTTDPDFLSIPYYQVFDFKHGFTPNLSIIDLLFNLGNESLILLQESIKKTS